MTAKLKAKWLAALRSGDYEQYKGGLFRGDDKGFCCLGVLAQISSIKNLRENVLATSIFHEAADRNDGDNDFEGKPQTFAQIADWLETVL